METKDVRALRGVAERNGSKRRFLDGEVDLAPSEGRGARPARAEARASQPSSDRMTRVLVADGDREAREGAAFVLRRAGCSVVPCPGAMSLVRAIEAHQRGCPGGRLSVLVVSSPLPQAGDVAELARLGVFELGVPVIVTMRAPTHAVERVALAAGATLVSSGGIGTTASAVRHVIEQEKRWGGEWISTGLLERLT